MLDESFVRKFRFFSLAATCVPVVLALAGCGGAGTDGERVGAQGALLSTSASFGFGWTKSTVSAATSYSTSGLPVSVTHTVGSGIYQVKFQGLGDAGGNAQVVAIGTTPVTCSVTSLTAAGPDELVNIRCFTVATGANADTDFAAYFGKRTVADEIGTQNGAYLTSDGAAGVVPGSEWSSVGSPASISILSAGRYSVKLPGQSASEGNAQVTAFGNANTHCKVEQWITSGGATQVIVDCFKNNVADSSAFSLLYTAKQLPTTRTGAYMAAERPFIAGPYIGLPAINRIFTPALAAGSATSTRLAASQYVTTYPSFATTSGSSTVLLTANGSGPNYCHPTSWSAAGADEKVNVKCFSPSGGAGDTVYTQMFLRSF
jgi:hypothetical protein